MLLVHLLFAVIVLSAALLLLLSSPIDAWTPTLIPTSGPVTILPTRWPLCRLPAVCAARSPRVCGRAEDGMCRRFRNICELLELNRPDLSSSNQVTWTHTQERDCRTVRGVGAAYATWCHQDCPRRPVACRRTPRSQEICVRSRNHRQCKVVANRCQLLNSNCHSRPRNSKCCQSPGVLLHSSLVFSLVPLQIGCRQTSASVARCSWVISLVPAHRCRSLGGPM